VGEFRFSLRTAIAALTTAISIALVGVPTAYAATVTYQIVTNEIEAKQEDGTSVEAYRFDPAIYPVQQGDEVVLQIRGLKGHDHPIEIEGYNIKDVVRRNAVTSIRFKASKPGVYRVICTAHADAKHNGPMEGYLVVIPSAKKPR